MRKLTTILFVITSVIVAFSQPYTFTNTTTYSIPDGDPWVNDGFVHGAESPITVSGIPPTAEIDYIIVNITHTWDSDLDIYLVYYDNRYDISSDNGGSGSNYTNTRFIVTGAPVTGGVAPFTGDFAPEQALPKFGAPDYTFNPNGVWTLNVCDDTGLDVGQIDSWTIVFKEPVCPTVDFIDEDNWVMTCDSAADLLQVTDMSVSGGTAYPTLYFEFNADGLGIETNNNVVIYEDGAVIYSGTVLNDQRLTVYTTGPFMSPSSIYTVDVSNIDGTTDWMIFDGNGVIHTQGTVTNASLTNLGACSPNGIGTWSGTGLSATSDYGYAIFDPTTVGAGTYNITYSWDNQGIGAYACSGTATHTITVNNPYSAAWTAPTTTYCLDAANVDLSGNITGTTGGSWSGNGMSTTGIFAPGTAGAGTHTITYTYDSGGPCQLSESHTITVNPLPVVTVGSNSAICDGQDLNLTESGNEATSWSWTGPNAFSSTDQNPTIIGASTLYSGTYYVTITNSTTGCTNTANTSVTVNALPTVTASSDDVNNEICVGDAITLTGGGADSYSWDNGVNNGTAFTPTATNTYTVTGQNSTTGCENTAQITITVNPLPNVFAGADQSITYGSSTTISDASPAGLVTYSWTPIDSLIDASIQNPTTQNLFTTNTFTLTGTDANGCTNSDDVVITIIGGPLTVNLSASLNDTICLGDSVTIFASASGASGNYTYNWSSNPTGTYTDTNTIYVSPTVTTDYYVHVVDGVNNAYDTITITVISLPLISSVTTTDLLCNGDNTGEITINATGNGTLSYSINDGVNYSQNNGQFTNMDIGTGFITVVQDSFGCIAYGDTVSISQPNPITSSIVSIIDASCGSDNGEVTVTSSGGTPGYTYAWETGQTPVNDSVYSNIATGNYVVTVTDSHNCEFTLNYFIDDLGGGSLSINSVSDVLCYGGLTGTITADITGGTPNFTFTITQGLDTILTTGSVDSVFIVDTLSAGNYTLISIEGAGCSSSIDFTIGEADALIINDSIVNISCYNSNDGQIFIDAQGGTPSYTYLWSNGATTSFIDNLPEGMYSVIITDNNNCNKGLDSLFITNPLELSGNITINQNINCYNDSTGELLAVAETGTAPFSYLWSNGGNNAINNNLTDGNYTVTITDNNGCTLTLDTSLNSPSQIIISDSVFYTNYQGNILIFANGGTPNYTYNWSNGATDSLLTNLVSGNYWVSVSDANGCVVENYYKIDIPLNIPSVITPNNDGKNDRFNITNINAYKTIDIKVFNRWGDIIFEYSGTGNGYADSSKQWDGTYNGKELPVGSFVYIIDLKNNEDPYTGTVTIVR